MTGTPRLRLWLLRHAQPQDAQGLCYGAREVPVARADTEAAAQIFLKAWANAHPLVVPRLWVSERQRAQDLAHALCAHWHGSTPRTDTRLNEFDFGEWEGTPWDQIPKAALDAWTADFAHHRFGGRDSTGALVERVHDALQALRLDPPSGPVIWVTHAGVIRAVDWLQRSEPTHALRADTWPLEAPGFGQWRVLDFP